MANVVSNQAANSLAQSLAVGVASVLISYKLVPESVIYTKEELANNVVLSENERLKRKLFIAYLIYQGTYRLPKNILNMSNTLSSNSAKKHCMLAAQMLSATPGFALSLKIAMKAANGEELTAKKEDYLSDAERKVIAGTSFIGGVATGFIRQRM